MTNDEIIKQLESLLSHCKSMIEKDGGFPIWEKDCEALEAAIAALRPSGEPLTLEQLRGMDGKPVFCVSLINGKPGEWCIIRVVEMSKTWFIACAGAAQGFGDKDTYAKTWLAYAYPPIGRDKWEPCEVCAEESDPCLKDNCFRRSARVCGYNCDKLVRYINKAKRIHDANFCPKCGRPLTEAAWEELEKRLRG